MPLGPETKNLLVLELVQVEEGFAPPPLPLFYHLVPTDPTPYPRVLPNGSHILATWHILDEDASEDSAHGMRFLA